jgi:hypothetical protein
MTDLTRKEVEEFVQDLKEGRTIDLWGKAACVAQALISAWEEAQRLRTALDETENMLADRVSSEHKAIQEAQRLRKLIEEFEWADKSEGIRARTCPCCHTWYGNEHNTGCEYAKLREAARQSLKPTDTEEEKK